MTTLHITSLDNIAAATHAARYADTRVAGWVAGQCWRWDGGDAITVVTGTLLEIVRTFVVLRLGTTVRIYQTDGLMGALRLAGENAADYRVA